MRISTMGLLLTVVLAGVARPVAGQAVSAPASTGSLPISQESFQRVPETYQAEGIAADGVTAMFIAGPEWKGRPTRIFAWYGKPPKATTAKVPAMVLIHGGGGTAFERWVKFWNSRGYAAIAIDTCGCVPRGAYANWQRHEQGRTTGLGCQFLATS